MCNVAKLFVCVKTITDLAFEPTLHTIKLSASMHYDAPLPLPKKRLLTEGLFFAWVSIASKIFTSKKNIAGYIHVRTPKKTFFS